MIEHAPEVPARRLSLVADPVPKRRPKATGVPSGLPAITDTLAHALANYRIATVAQLRLMLRRGDSYPTAHWVGEALCAMEAAGLATRVGRAGSRQQVWFLTPGGYSSLAGGETRPHRTTRAKALGGLQAHALAVTDAALAFVAAADALGDDCPALGVRLECLLAYRGSKTIADAVVAYRRRADGRRVVRALEVERGTKPGWAVAGKLRGYALARADGRAAKTYGGFPAPIVVLAGDGVEGRFDAFMAAAGALAEAEGLGAVVTTQRLLALHGPLAPVFIPVDDPLNPVSLFG